MTLWKVIIVIIRRLTPCTFEHEVRDEARDVARRRERHRRVARADNCNLARGDVPPEPREQRALREVARLEERVPAFCISAYMPPRRASRTTVRDP